MSLAVGNRVFLDVSSILMSDPPLFGLVDKVDGVAPDLVRVNWENGAQQTFSVTTGLVAFTDDPDATLVGATVTVAGGHNGTVLRAMVLGVGKRKLVRTSDGLYALIPY